MKTFRNYIVEGFYKNVGSNIDDAIWDWLVGLYSDYTDTVKDLERNKTSLINQDHSINTKVLNNIVGDPLMSSSSNAVELTIGDKDLVNGEFPSYVKFDHPVYMINISDSNITSLKSLPAASRYLGIIECNKLKDFKGIPVMRKLNHLIIKDCDSLESIDDLKCKMNKDKYESGRLKLVNCPKLNVTSGVISRITKGASQMTIEIDRHILEDLRNANMYHEFDGIDCIMGFYIYNSGDPNSCLKLIEDMVPRNRLPLRTHNSTIRMYGSPYISTYKTPSGITVTALKENG